mgnify:CR=1 FL=1
MARLPCFDETRRPDMQQAQLGAEDRVSPQTHVGNQCLGAVGSRVDTEEDVAQRCLCRVIHLERASRAESARRARSCAACGLQRVNSCRAHRFCGLGGQVEHSSGWLESDTHHALRDAHDGALHTVAPCPVKRRGEEARSALRHGKAQIARTIPQALRERLGTLGRHTRGAAAHEGVVHGKGGKAFAE